MRTQISENEKKIFGGVVLSLILFLSTLYVWLFWEIEDPLKIFFSCPNINVLLEDFISACCIASTTFFFACTLIRMNKVIYESMKDHSINFYILGLFCFWCVFLIPACLMFIFMVLSNDFMLKMGFAITGLYLGVISNHRLKVLG